MNQRFIVPEGIVSKNWLFKSIYGWFAICFLRDLVFSCTAFAPLGSNQFQIAAAYLNKG